MGCSPVLPVGGDVVEPAPQVRSELARLAVERPDGAVELIYAHVGVPAEPGPHPVVVFAHGQSVDAAFNCGSGPPSDRSSVHAQWVTQVLAEEGWLVVAPLFRNRGDTAPLVGALRPRDHHLLDASAVLAAARHGQAHPRGGGPVGLVGISMGTFPVLWAATAHPDLDPIAEGLDLRVAVAAGMLGDQLGTLGRTAQAFVAEEELAVAEGITQAVAGTVTTMSFPRGVDPVTDLGFVDDVLTPRGRELARRGLLEPADPRSAACWELTAAPICSTECFVDVFFQVLDDEPVAPQTFLQGAALDALAHWSETGGADPGADSANPVLAALREASPAYGLPVARVQTLVTMLGAGDEVVTEQLLVGEHPRERYLDALRATGAELVDLRLADPACEHDDYLDLEQPDCGYDALRDQLHRALE